DAAEEIADCEVVNVCDQEPKQGGEYKITAEPDQGLYGAAVERQMEPIRLNNNVSQSRENLGSHEAQHQRPDSEASEGEADGKRRVRDLGDEVRYRDGTDLSVCDMRGRGNIGSAGNELTEC